MTETYTFRYGDGTVDVSLPAGISARVLTGNECAPVTDIRKTLFDTFEQPTGCAPLKERLKSGMKVAFIISDMSRFWMRQDLVIPHVMDYLNGVCGIPDSDVTIIVANGTHADGDEKELRTLVTDEIFDRVKVVNHHCLDEDNLTYIGTTSFGNRIEINSIAAQADFVLALGAVTHHVMAGFGGGRKSILPGISSSETIRFNHQLSLDDKEFIPNPLTGNGVLDGNPVNLDMIEAASFLKEMFVINLVMNTDMILSDICSGDLIKSWRTACDKVDSIYSVPVEKPADIIIAGCGGYPKDMSMYQGTKTIDNIEGFLKEGGTLVFIAEARDGGGPVEYFGWKKDLIEGTFEHRLRNDFTIPGFIFFLNVRQAHKFNILMYSSIPSEEVEPMGMKSFQDMDEIIKQIDFQDKEVYILPCGGTVIPRLK